MHRRIGLGREDLARHRGIPVTSPVCTLVDLAPRLPTKQLEAVINEADTLDLVNPESAAAGARRSSGPPWCCGASEAARPPDVVVETDGLRYHRTPAQQARDRRRDQAHLATGLKPLRFTHAQVKFEPAYVEATLTAVAG